MSWPETSHPGWTLLWRWGPLCLWVAVVSGFSTSAFSAKHTGQFIVPFLHWLFPGASSDILLEWHGMVRKGMHMAEFAVLALLWYRGLSWGKRGWQPGAALTAFGLAIACAAADEFHQVFVPSRTASVLDVAWDGLGAFCGLVGQSGLAATLQPSEKSNTPEDAPPRCLEVSAGD